MKRKPEAATGAPFGGLFLLPSASAFQVKPHRLKNHRKLHPGDDEQHWH
jgi:hypothetical protein